MQELRDHKEEKEDASIAINVHNASRNLDNLGIIENMEGVNYEKCGKQSKKCGRKTLAELRTVIGMVANNKNINEILNVGKGKSLPKDPLKPQHEMLGA